MNKVIVSLAILSLMSLNNNAQAQGGTGVNMSVPTEVGTTTIPPGQYTLTEINTGKKYSLMVSSKGTMICGAAPAAKAASRVTSRASVRGATAPSAAASSTSGLKGLAESQIQKGVTNYIEKEGMGEVKNFIK